MSVTLQVWTAIAEQRGHQIRCLFANRGAALLVDTATGGSLFSLHVLRSLAFAKTDES